MLIRLGFNLAFDTFGPTPMNLLLSVRPERVPDLVTPEVIAFDPPVPARRFTDGFGNVCTRIVAPGGRISMSADFVIRDSRRARSGRPGCRQHPVEDLPDDVLPFLLGSRYCDTDKLSASPGRSSATRPGLGAGAGDRRFRAQAHPLRLPEGRRRPARPSTATRSESGVCRDFAHLAIALCRCMNIPARYCTGYLGDIGMPPVPDPMDFSAWFEVYLGRTLAHLRRPPQHAADRPHRHGARPRRDRLRADHELRSGTAGAV